MGPSNILQLLAATSINNCHTSGDVVEVRFDNRDDNPS